jgi:hypothetical protein
MFAEEPIGTLAAYQVKATIDSRQYELWEMP